MSLMSTWLWITTFISIWFWGTFALMNRIYPKLEKTPAPQTF